MPNLLIIDDSPEILEILQLVFQIKGYTADAVNSKKSFTEQFEKSRPDLILLDVNLWDGDGREICMGIKKDEATKNIPIILISANPENLQAYQDYCADAVLEKPFNLDDLMSTVENLLAR